MIDGVRGRGAIMAGRGSGSYIFSVRRSNDDKTSDATLTTTANQSGISDFAGLKAMYMYWPFSLHSLLDCLGSQQRLSKDIATVTHDIRLVPIFDGRVSFDAAIAPCVAWPAVNRPVGIDVRPASKVVLLDHVLDTGQIGDEIICRVRGWWLYRRLGDPLGFSCKLNILEDIWIQDRPVAV
ncbi:hypothetical protein EV356DRAFT_45575 [Viridothelium virens]|uniref:Uncharacterized protein n=1 Tax=Viridothelium virens TaxID=1048519 RepID=A0A6A6GT15_VIRVR|nr:hypothetical protein EV356DRAFT_45575 [Viridothelium virens]